MCKLIEYSDNYLKTSGVLRQFYRNVPAVDNNGTIVDFNAGNPTSRSFNFCETSDDGTKHIEIMVPLKYISNFCRILEMILLIMTLILI